MRMPQLKILIIKRVSAKDTRTPRTIAVHEIASLNHEVGNNAVESTALVPAAALRLARAELAEVLRCRGYNVKEEFHLDAAGWLAANCNVKVYDGVVGGPARFYRGTFVGDGDVLLGLRG